MAEHIAALQELQKLPDGIHIFCPRNGENVPESTEDESRQRRERFFLALPLLAYDGDDIVRYHKWLYEMLDSQLSNCEACIRHYYLGKVDFKQQLLQEYDDGEVQDFLEIISRRDVERIRNGLSAATKKLEALPAAQRKPVVLQNSMLFAFYETLHCPAFFQDESALTAHFDNPFRLVQTHKELKIKEILPAVTKFLFATNQYRLDWAVRTWSRLGRDLTDEEWDWAVKDIIRQELDSIQNDVGLERFWSALRIIAQKLTEEQIRVKLFDMGFNFAKLSLDHLARKSMAVKQISLTLAILWEKEPNAYWDALTSVSSATVAEQFFASPNFDKALEQQTAGHEAAGEADVLAWIQPLLSGLAPANRPPAARTVVHQLLNRVKSGNLSTVSKKHCYRMVVSCLQIVILAFSEHEEVRKSTARPVLSDALTMVATNLSAILEVYPKFPDNEPDAAKSATPQQTSVQVLIKNSLALDCQILKYDYECLVREAPKAQHSSYTPDLWKTVKTALSPDNPAMSMAFVRGTMDLLGIEPFKVKDNVPHKAEKESFNTIFEKLEDAVSQCVDQFSDFPPSHLDNLFAVQDCNMATMALLLSGNETIYLSTAESFKTIAASPDRLEALGHVFDAFFSHCLYSTCWVFRRITSNMACRPIPRLLSTVKDLLDIFCDNSGLLRTRNMNKREGFSQQQLARERHAVQAYWSYSWQLLTMIFTRMEKWSIDQSNKELMTQVCRNTMQYAKALFDQYYVFLNVVRGGNSDLDQADIRRILLNTTDDNSSSNGSPVKALYAMVKWLRLKDSYLADTLATLITEMLGRLKDFGCQMSEDSEALKFIEEVASTRNGKSIKTILSSAQKASLIRALENYTGKQIVQSVPIKTKQQRLDLESWSKHGKDKEHAIPVDDGKEAVVGDRPESKDIALRKSESSQARKVPSSVVKPTLPSKSELARKAEEDARKKAFIDQRRKDQAIAEKKRAELASRNRGKSGSTHTANAGSGLAGLGIQGKDHTIKRSDLMVSSDSESSDGDLEDELFGTSKTTSGTSTPASRSGPVVPMPLKKIKQARSAKDMRARLSPDLTNLHKTILAWDFFAETETPPNSNKSDYTLVTNRFRSVKEYQDTFEPLLVLEGWQSFRQAREEGTFKCFELKIASSLIVDNFFEVNSTVPMLEGRDLGLGTSDLVLLSKSKKPHEDKSEPHCFARIKEITRKRGEIQITYRVNSANNPMRQHLHDKATIHAAVVSNLTTLEREYGALMALPYYDLVDEIINATPSPLLDYSDSEVENIKRVHNLNTAQAKAVKSAVDNDAFTLVQGPPGSGKTKTITAILSAIMTGVDEIPRATGGVGPPPANKKILVAAPSNAAVDELVMRFKDGIKLNDGRVEKINVVRLGRSEAINTTVKDVTLEELVTARLEETSGPTKGKEDIGAVMMEHKAASAEMAELRNKMDTTRQSGDKVTDADEQLFEALKRKKTTLSAQIDNIREKQNTASRDADITRRRIEQEILDKAHVICSTLSGSGQEKVQSLNVEFETVIIDEAAQSIELSALIPLKYGCSKCILVGDPKQLPPTVLSREAAKYQYEQSLFARMENNHKKDVHLLDTQYRMHPNISAFPSKSFYDSKLRDGPDMARLRARPWHGSPLFGPYRFFDVQGLQKSAPKGRSLVNEAEIEMALAMYDRLITDVSKYNFNNKVGIITPYKGQLKALKDAFRRAYGESIWNKIDFNTTDAFQGRESEIIIFSCVRASTQGIGFLKDIRRMNVALTRAKCSLWVLGNTNALKQGEFWNALIQDSKSRNVHSTGDTLKLFSKPVLTPEMMIEDTEMAGMDESSYETAQSAADSPVKPADSRSPASLEDRVHPRQSINVQPQPSSSRTINGDLERSRSNKSNPALDASRASTKGVAPKSTHPSDQSRQAGVGKPGLNSNTNCAVCGSNEHFASNCDNKKAKEAQTGHCKRCGEPGHFKAYCSTPRCLTCGEMGHVEKHCKAAPQQRLTQEERRHVQQEEDSHKDFCAEQTAKRAKKQLGEHGASIPVIKSATDSTSKRKRDDEDTHPNHRKSSVSSGMSLSEPESKREKKPHLAPLGPARPGAPPMVRKKRDDASAMFAKKR